MKITHQDRRETAVLTLKGDLTGDSAERLRRAALERIDARARDFVLDLGGIDAIDSQGLEALLWIQDQCADRLGQVRLAAAGEVVADVLKITRLAGRLENHPDVDAAIQSLDVHHA